MSLSACLTRNFFFPRDATCARASPPGPGAPPVFSLLIFLHSFPLGLKVAVRGLCGAGESLPRPLKLPRQGCHCVLGLPTGERRPVGPRPRPRKGVEGGAWKLVRGMTLLYSAGRCGKKGDGVACPFLRNPPCRSSSTLQGCPRQASPFATSKLIGRAGRGEAWARTIRTASREKGVAVAAKAVAEALAANLLPSVAGPLPAAGAHGHRHQGHDHLYHHLAPQRPPRRGAPECPSKEARAAAARTPRRPLHPDKGGDGQGRERGTRAAARWSSG